MKSRAGPFGSLRVKVGLTYGLLLLAAVALAWWVMLAGAKRQRYEVRSVLGRGVADRIQRDAYLFQDGAPDQEAFEFISAATLTLNPSLELYLLSPSGEVLLSDAPPGALSRTRVNLAPARAAPDQVVILGDDPRSISGQAPVDVALLSDPENGRTLGYMYVVLGGVEGEASLVAIARSSPSLRRATQLVSLILLAGILATALASGFLTGPLRRLRQAMGGLDQGRLPRVVSVRSEDEIGVLARTYNNMARRIADQVGRLKHTDELRRELVANISHDLRTPTTALRGYLETLVSREGRIAEAERQQYLGVALRSAERLAQLVEQLFVLARFDARDVRLTTEPFSLAELAYDVVGKYALVASEQGIELTANAAADLAPVMGDIQLIERVIENLVKNAVQFTEPGGRVQVRASEVPDLDEVELRVTDTGRGISAADLPRIFDRSFRVDRSRGEGHSGTGLGLAISKQILDLHGTPIRVASKVGKGTSFRFRLPLA